jgi:hypothetical protein
MTLFVALGEVMIAVCMGASFLVRERISVALVAPVIDARI